MFNHCIRCKCKTCTDADRELDKLTRAKSRLATWKALTSEAYISLSTKDPVLSAFLTSHEVCHISKQEAHYKVFYLKCNVILRLSINDSQTFIISYLYFSISSNHRFQIPFFDKRVSMNSDTKYKLLFDHISFMMT